MVRQRGSSFEADGIDAQGRRVRRSFKRRTSAEQFEQTVLNNSRDARLSIGHLFPVWADEIYTGTKNEREARRLIGVLTDTIGPATMIHNVNRPKLKEITKAFREQGNTQATVNRKLSILSKLLKHAVEEEVIEQAPHITLKTDPDSLRFRYLDEGEEDRMLASWEEDQQRYRMFTWWLLYTGCRYSEAKSITWADISHNRRTVTFWKTKTGKARTIPLTDEAFAAVEWTRRQGWDAPWSEIVYRTFLQDWHKARERAGLDEEVIPYTLRHTCATRLALGKMDVFRLMEWMGHANIATTQRYVKLNTANLDEAVNILSRNRPRSVRIGPQPVVEEVIEKVRHRRTGGGRS